MGTSCQEWRGAKDSSGYGNRTVGGKPIKAHRQAWIDVRGAIPDGMCVLHSCDNPSCVNVAHLFLGSKQDNYDDMARKGRAHKARGEASGQSKIRSEDASRIREAHLFGARQVDLASVFGLGQTTVSAITRGVTWR